MIRDELYINGVKADLGNVDISLNYNSNLLTDISKIISNNSYTVKLPKTAHNMALIECAHLPSAMSDFPYLKHAGRLVRDGIEIVGDANIVLLSVNETIEIALSWGNVTNFESVVNGDKTLTGLDYGMNEGVDYIIWKKGTSRKSFPIVDYGFLANEENAWYHPVVSAKWVFDKIAAENGITFDFSADKLKELDDIIIPLLSRNDAPKQIDACKMTLNFSGEMSYITQGSVAFCFSNKPQSNYYGYTQYESDGKLCRYRSYIKNGKIKLSGSLSIEVLAGELPSYVTFIVLQKGNEICSVPAKSIESVSQNRYRLTFELDNEETNVLSGENADDRMIDFHLGNIYDIDYFYNNTINGYLEISNYAEEVILRRSDEADGRFYFVPNLPDIKQIDFIKAIATMLGLFAIPAERNKIKFVSFDTLRQNIAKAVNWTDKVVRPYINKLQPREISYTLDGMTQHNWFRYKDDDSVKGDYASEITVNNKTLDYERDVITLPFSGSDTRGSVAYIPIYSYDSDGALQYEKCNSRILRMATVIYGSGDHYRVTYNGVFEGLDWRELLRNNYATYQMMISEAKIIKEYIKLSPVELKHIDMTVPVYLGQYGCYWAIINIKTKSNDICEVKLLKM